jgi:nucleoside-diphosphate-sugar epimerase
MRILIPGGAGCLGSNLVEHWVSSGHKVLVIDNFATGKAATLPPNPNIRVVVGSIADRDLVRHAFFEFKPTHIVHSAASYKNPNNWRGDASTNVLGTINLIEAAMELGVERFVNFQTALCYGRPDRVPIPVDHPLRPFTSYSISKVAAEQYLMASNLSWISLRITNVISPRLAIGPIPTFYRRLKAGQACFCTDAMRDFLDISDFNTAVDLVMAQPSVTGVFNVGSGEGHSVVEIYDIVRGHLGLAPDPGVRIEPIGPDDVAEVVLDPTKTKKALGWKATVNFNTTLDRMLSWYDVHGVSDVYSHLAAAAR